MAVNFNITVFLDATTCSVVVCYGHLEERTIFKLQVRKTILKMEAAFSSETLVMICVYTASHPKNRRENLSTRIRY
jgi:triosephosphate isomerase